MYPCEKNTVRCSSFVLLYLFIYLFLDAIFQNTFKLITPATLVLKHVNLNFYVKLDSFVLDKAGNKTARHCLSNTIKKNCCVVAVLINFRKVTNTERK